MYFDMDTLFGLKICLTVNQTVKFFLTSIQESEDLDKVKFCYFDSYFDQQCTKKSRFSCNLLPPLLELFDAATPRIQTEGGGVWGKWQRRNALSNPKQDDAGGAKAELVQSYNKNKDWILSPDEDYKKVFLGPIWSENPPPDLNR